MKLKDNVHRCPWCGNVDSIKSVRNLITGERYCSFCKHHCIRKIGRKTFFLIFTVCLTIIIFNTQSYAVIPLLFLIESILAHFALADPYIKSTKSLEKFSPTKGYKVKISLFPNQLKSQLLNDTVIPIVFISESGNPISLVCCMKIENGKWNKNILECDLKLLEFGEKPQEETNKFYVYNKGKLIADGNIISILSVSY